MKSFLLWAVLTASVPFAQSPAAQMPLLLRAQEAVPADGDVLRPDKAPKKEKAEAPPKISAEGVPSPEVIPALTFTEYQPSPVESSPYFEIRTSSEPSQEPFRASLVGVNINAWLENPDNYSALQEIARNFPIQSLLNNIAHYSPALVFNRPALVQSLLSSDIYTPFFANAAKAPKMPPLFSKRRGVVSFTRNYHIYGAAAGGLPYFGVPAEGADRRIILASVKDQLLEYSARLPDTDIFLVATINITPNWLEEGWDVRQVNRQNAEIIVYAFNRKGRLIGGGGLPKNFLSKGSFITFSQKIQSKVWQPSVSRAFYLWPSFKIINTPVPGSEKQAPAAVLPPSARPYLNRMQKYIVKSLENIRALGLPPQTPLFDTEGEAVYDMQKAPASPKVFLAKRSLYLTNSPLETNPALNFSPRAFAELEGSAPREDFEANEAAVSAYRLKKQQEAEQKELQKQEEDRLKAEREAEKDRLKAEKEAEKARIQADKERRKAEETSEGEPLALSYALPSLLQAPLLLRGQNIGDPNQSAPDAREKIAENRNKKAAKERSSISEGFRRRKYQPSNEKEKLQSLLNGVSQMLEQAPFFTTNDILAVSNNIPAFETESDPVSYSSERKKYYSVRISSRLLGRQFKKDTALFQRALEARLEDEIFWAALYRKAIQDNQLWTPEMEEAYIPYLEQLRIRKKMELTRFKYNRDSELIQSLVSNVPLFGERELAYHSLRIKKPEKLAKKTVWNQENMSKALSRHSAKFFKEDYLEQKAKFQEEYLAAAQEFNGAYAAYRATLPRGAKVAFLNDSVPNPEELLSQNNQLWAGLAERNRVPIELVAYVESNNFLYPSKRFRIALQRKALRAYKKDMRFVTFEGFSLGLSGNWKSKTFTADRLTEL